MIKNAVAKLLNFYELELWDGSFRLQVPPPEQPNALCVALRDEPYQANCFEKVGSICYRPLYITLKCYQTLNDSCSKSLLVILGIVPVLFSLLGLIFSSIGGRWNSGRRWKNEAFRFLQEIYGIYESRLKQRVDFLSQEYATLLGNPSSRLSVTSAPGIKESNEQLFRLYAEYNYCIQQMRGK